MSHASSMVGGVFRPIMCSLPNILCNDRRPASSSWQTRRCEPVLFHAVGTLGLVGYVLPALRYTPALPAKAQTASPHRACLFLLSSGRSWFSVSFSINVFKLFAYFIGEYVRDRLVAHGFLFPGSMNCPTSAGALRGFLLNYSVLTHR